MGDEVSCEESVLPELGTRVEVNQRGGRRGVVSGFGFVLEAGRSRPMIVVHLDVEAGGWLTAGPRNDVPGSSCVDAVFVRELVCAPSSVFEVLEAECVVCGRRGCDAYHPQGDR